MGQGPPGRDGKDCVCTSDMAHTPSDASTTMVNCNIPISALTLGMGSIPWKPEWPDKAIEGTYASNGVLFGYSGGEPIKDANGHRACRWNQDKPLQCEMMQYLPQYDKPYEGSFANMSLQVPEAACYVLGGKNMGKVPKK